MTTDTVLHLEDLRVTYATPRGRVVAVDGVTFSLERGETFGLVGESGSGKTTTASAILRLLGPQARTESGRALLDGVDLLGLPEDRLRRVRWKEIALIPQGAMNSLNPVVKIHDQIKDAILTHEGPGARRGLRERIRALLESVGLPPRTDDLFPHELSGGMKQRVCIAMAIALGPKLIIADEPTSALDVVVQRMVAETLREVQARLDATVLLIGHDMGVQAQLVDRLGIMYRGKVVEIGPVRSIFKQPRHPYTQRLIASIPSIGRGTTLAERVLSGAIDTESAIRGPDWSAAPESIPPLREIAPGHFAALA
jgi:peptide/nickel transport system ATP-binding protein